MCSVKGSILGGNGKDLFQHFLENINRKSRNDGSWNLQFDDDNHGSHFDLCGLICKSLATSVETTLPGIKLDPSPNIPGIRSIFSEARRHDERMSVLC